MVTILNKTLSIRVTGPATRDVTDTARFIGAASLAVGVTKKKAPIRAEKSSHAEAM